MRIRKMPFAISKKAVNYAAVKTTLAFTDAGSHTAFIYRTQHRRNQFVLFDNIFIACGGNYACV